MEKYKFLACGGTDIFIKLQMNHFMCYICCYVFHDFGVSNQWNGIWTVSL